MKTIYLAAIATLSLGIGSVSAQDAVAVATESGVCGDAAVVSATFIDSGTIEAVCESNPEAFVPVAGPLLALALAAVLAGNNNGPGSTGSTSGTN